VTRVPTHDSRTVMFMGSREGGDTLKHSFQVHEVLEQGNREIGAPLAILFS